MSESDFGHPEDSVTIIIDIYMAKLIVVNTSSQKKKKRVVGLMSGQSALTL